MSNFIQINAALYEEILLRDLKPTMVKILLLLLRLTDGCNKGRTKNACVILNKNDFEAIGVPVQSIIRTLKELVKKNVIFETNITLTFNNKDMELYMYGINYNFTTWEIDYTKNEEVVRKKLNKSLSLNLRLKPMQLAKMNNIKRIENYKLLFKTKTPEDFLISKINHICKQDCLNIDDFFIVQNNDGQDTILLGYKNICSGQVYENLSDYSSNQQVILALNLLDLMLVFKMIEISNGDVKDHLLKILEEPSAWFKMIFSYWQENLCEDKEKLIMQKCIELSINDAFKKFESQNFYTKVIYNGENEYAKNLFK